MSFKSTESMSAAELMARLQSDPEWVRKNAERESKQNATEAAIRLESESLIADLKAVGMNVASVWDLVNLSTSYPQAIPVLCRHLLRPYRHEITEGIARALTVAEARGSAARVILAELQRLPDGAQHSVRWALANALTKCADASMLTEIKALVADDRYKDVRERLKVTLAEIGERPS